MNLLIEFLISNAEWLLSGVGTAVAAIIYVLLLRRPHVLYPPETISTIPGSDAAKSLTDLTSKLQEISNEIDNATRSLSLDIENRQKALNQLIDKNESLAKEEADLNARVSALKDMPLEVADYFKSITEKHLKKYEKRSSKRDMVMFLFGIAATTIVSIIIAILMN